MKTGVGGNGVGLTGYGGGDGVGDDGPELGLVGVGGEVHVVNDCGELVGC